MPKITELNGYIIYFWSREGVEPCHVHVSRKRAVKNATKIWITPAVKIAHNKSNIPKKDLNKILAWIENNKSIILDAWQKHFR